MTSTLDVVVHIWKHPANRGRRVRVLGKAVGWQLYKRATGRHWDIRYVDDVSIRCFPDSTSASLVLYTSGLPDYEEMLFAKAYLRRGDGFLDVGANVGVYALFVSQIVGPLGYVEAFEPGEPAFTRLADNVSQNGLSNVRLHKAAASDSDGLAFFTKGWDAGNRLATAPDVPSKLTEVPCIRLDSAAGDRRFRLGKMDIEGAEPIALAGAERMLSRGNPPVWIFEVKDRLLRRFGHSAKRLSTILFDWGFELAKYEPSVGRLVVHQRPWEREGNYIAVHESARQEVKDRLASFAESDQR